MGTQILKDIPLLISYSIAKSREKLVWIIKKSFLLVKNTLTQSISWVRDQTVSSFLNKISSKLDVISAKMTSALSLSRVLSAKYTRWLSRIYLTALFILRYSLGFSYFSMIGISMTLPVVKASSVSSFRSVKSLFVRPHPNRLKSDQNESISSSASHIPSAGVSRL